MHTRTCTHLHTLFPRVFHTPDGCQHSRAPPEYRNTHSLAATAAAYAFHGNAQLSLVGVVRHIHHLPLGSRSEHQQRHVRHSPRQRRPQFIPRHPGRRLLPAAYRQPLHEKFSLARLSFLRAFATLSGIFFVCAVHASLKLLIWCAVCRIQQPFSFWS